MNDAYPGLRSALMNLRGQSTLRGVEIGLATGYHAEDILEELDMESLFLVDPFLPYMDHDDAEMQEWFLAAAKRIWRFREYEDFSFMFMTSEDAASLFAAHTLDFVYIDGDHHYDAVCRDLELWWDRVRIGGLFCGHDYRRREVARLHFGSEKNLTTAVQDFAKEKGRELHYNVDDMDWWLTR